MPIENLKNSTLTEIVSQNYVFASILYYFCIKFFEYSEVPLNEVCREKGIDVKKVISELSKPSSDDFDENKLSKFPIDFLVEFLKHSHYVFAKKRLPYIASLISSLEIVKENSIERDLQILFPMFVEDFIQHIYFEEESFFRYVIQLYKGVSGNFNHGKLYYQMKKNSVADFANEHEAHDDVMAGIRKITKDYSIDSSTDLQLSVIYSELISFERDLINHANIENNILFPKALGIENEARKMIESTSKLN